ncbi:MAG: hypothetical protein WBX27_14630 [Specibacter sp.]
MQLIAQINSRSDPKKPYREQTVEADSYENAYQQIADSLAEDDRLLSVRYA